jgi:hypothetical protein
VASLITCNYSIESRKKDSKTMYTAIKFTQTVFSRLIPSNRSHEHKTVTGRTPVVL